MKHTMLLLLVLAGFAGIACAQEITLRPNSVITQSCKIKPGNYTIDGDTALRFDGDFELDRLRPVVLITGDNITVDFQNATLHSQSDPTRPDLFTGVAILVTGKGVTLRNANIRGYKVAILANGADNLTLENCIVAYNYRPKLRSGYEREDFADWLSYHHNEKHQWLRYGAGIYLNQCQNATVRTCYATGNQNALLLNDCNDGLFYNNTFQFNSGLGIGLYRSSGNRIMHNRLDWNVRGYSHGKYQRGQDSAALLLYEQSHNNLIAYNSCTHSGDGLFLWAGQSTMDYGEGGCNDNRIHGNDFSYAPTNGIEVTFSRNTITGNMIRECTYGIWGGYSYDTRISGNMITGCQTAIAIEHGQRDTILQNFLLRDSVGVRLWARKNQPADWGYAQKKDVQSMGSLIDRNVFMQIPKPLQISGSKDIQVNGENLFLEFETVLETEQPNTNLKFLRNDLYASPESLKRSFEQIDLAAQRKLNFEYPDQRPPNPFKPLDIQVNTLNEPDSLPGGMDAGLKQGDPQGRKNIIIEPWGPYNFKRPLAKISNQNLPFPNYVGLDILGPDGNWKMVNMSGIQKMNRLAGRVPDQLISVQTIPDAEEVWIQFAYTGPNTITDEFGRTFTPTPDSPYLFSYHQYHKKIDWQLRFYPYDAATDPLTNPEAVAQLESLPAMDTLSADTLYFAWWDAPTPKIPADKFLTIATAEAEFEYGKYLIELGSDDGVRLYVDDQLVIDHWDVHEPATDERILDLGGRHRLRIEHFDAGGFATLDFRIRPYRD